jgi:hypothetical protein
MRAIPRTFIPASVLLLLPLSASGQVPLDDLYRGGEIQLVPEFVVTDQDLPDGIYFESFEQAWSIARDSAGVLYFADFGANHIKVFDADGTFQRIMGRQGAGPAEFNTPYFTTISDDRLVVWDMGNARFCILTLEGELLSTRNLNRGEEGWPHRLQALPDGRILMESEKRHPENPREMSMQVLRLYTSDLTFLRTVYQHEVQSQKWLPEEQANIPVPFRPSLHWGLQPDGRIVLGFGDHYHIEVYDVDEGLLFSFDHDRSPARITSADKEQWFAGIVSSRDGVVREGAPEFIVKNTEFPRYMPAFDQILVDSEGNVLIHAYLEGVQEERFRYRFYDTFDSEGTYIGEIQVEGEGRFPIGGVQIIDKCFITGESAETGEIRLIKYRISPWSPPPTSGWADHPSKPLLVAVSLTALFSPGLMSAGVQVRLVSFVFTVKSNLR